MSEPPQLGKFSQLLRFTETEGSLAVFSALLLLSGVLTANLWWAKPAYNWDLVGYVGVAVSFDGGNADDIHQATFNEIRENVPPDNYGLLTGDAIEHDYRIAVANDSNRFLQQLPFYAVKPLYPAMMSILGKLGVNLVSASVLISKTAYCLIGLLSLVWTSRHYPPLIAAVIASSVCSLPFVLALSTSSTPDALSTLLLLSGFFLLAETARTRTAFTILLVAILARPDNMLLVLIIAAIGLVRWEGGRGQSVVTALLAVAVYSAESLWSGNYGWQSLIHHGFVGYLQTPELTDVNVSVGQYLNILARNSHPLIMPTFSYSLLLFVFLGVLTVRLIWVCGRAHTRAMDVLTAALMYTGCHWLIFPSQAERLLVAFYILVLLILTVEVQRNSKSVKAKESS